MTPPDPVGTFEDHGGDLDRAGEQFGDPPDGWLDLSTGINPRAYPLPDLTRDAWQRLPMASALNALKVAAADAFDATSKDFIACAPGTQALIQILPRAMGVGRVAVLGPTYSEHATAWQAADAEVEETRDLPAPDRSAVLVNPNNPDGRVVPPEDLISWARSAAPAGHWLIIDEAFAEVVPEASVVPAMPLENVIILRSFGKFHGLAGLRLGFAVTAPETVRRLEREMGPWAVSGPALEVGAAALADRVWVSSERRRLAGDMTRLRRLLEDAGAQIIGGTDLFVLVEHAGAAGLYDHLARTGILVRRFAGNPHWLRFGLPDAEADWERLAAALRVFPTDAAKGAREYG